MFGSTTIVAKDDAVPTAPVAMSHDRCPLHHSQNCFPAKNLRRLADENRVCRNEKPPYAISFAAEFRKLFPFQNEYNLDFFETGSS